MMPRPRKKTRDDLPDNLYKENRAKGTYWRYKRPDTGQFKALGYVTKTEAIKAAKELNALLTDQSLTNKVLDKNTSFGVFLKVMRDEILPNRRIKGQLLSPKTLKDYSGIINLLDKQFGKLSFPDVRLSRISAYLDKLPPNTSNKHRQMLTMVFKYAMSKELCDDNPAEKTIKKDDVKKRKPLELDAFNAIYGLAPQWFKNAMDIALYSLQARQDICRIKFNADLSKFEIGLNDNNLYIIRHKVKNYKTAYIRIQLDQSPQLQTILQRCRDDIASPYLIHYLPEHRKSRAQRSQFKDHHTQLAPEQLSRTFKKYRDLSGLFDHLTAEEKPTFHEIRHLGSRLLEKETDDLEGLKNLQSLLCHSDKKMTAVYLESDDIEWIDVHANLKITK